MQEYKTARMPERFLVVANDADITEMFVMLFSVLGYDIKTATSPQRAIEIAKDIAPDIIYTSLVFDKMNGFELCTHLRGLPMLRNTRIIALTGLQFPGLATFCKEAGFDQYLLKPFSIEALANTIDPTEGERVRRMIAR